MKIILANKEELIVTRVNVNYSTRNTETERRSIVLTIDDPTVTINDIVTKLTTPNLVRVEIVSKAATVVKENIKLDDISENISDEGHNIEIRFSE